MAQAVSTDKARTRRIWDKCGEFGKAYIILYDGRMVANIRGYFTPNTTDGGPTFHAAMWTYPIGDKLQPRYVENKAQCNGCASYVAGGKGFDKVAYCIANILLALRNDMELVYGLEFPLPGTVPEGDVVSWMMEHWQDMFRAAQYVVVEAM